MILGGKDKGSDYSVLQTALRERAVSALLIGEAAEKIAGQIGGSVAFERAERLSVRWNLRRQRRGRAMWFCWRRRVRVSISLRTMSIAEERFKDLVKRRAEASGSANAAASGAKDA